MSDSKGKSSSRTNVLDKVSIEPPKYYKVIFLNDDITTMEFVVFVLVKIFEKDNKNAHLLMLDIHHKGSAVVGEYPKDIAYTKAEFTKKLAKDQNYPLQIKVERV
ncbi:MAG: ATP-dependent Clp protease adaptor ClpS [Lachnospirales bacterium]